MLLSSSGVGCGGGRGQIEVQAGSAIGARTTDLRHEPPEMGGLDHRQPAAAVLRRQAEIVDGGADECPERVTLLGAQFGQGHDFVDDAGQFEAGLRSLDLHREERLAEVVELAVEKTDQPNVLGGRVLQMREPADHLLAEQPVGRAEIRLAGAVGLGLGLTLAPLKANARGDGDAVDEDRVVLVELAGGTEGRADPREVSGPIGLVVPHGRVGAADPGGEIAGDLPVADADLVAGPALNGQLARLEVQEKRSLRIEGQQLRGLADAGGAREHPLDAARLAQAFVGRDDAERPAAEGGAHLPPSRSRTAAEMATSAPEAPWRRAIFSTSPSALVSR